MHSSRMHTVCCSGCLLGVCLSGGCLPRGVFAQGVSAQGVCLPRGVSVWGCLSRECLADTPQIESQTGVKTLPCRNYVADGNDRIGFISIRVCRLIMFSVASICLGYNLRTASDGKLNGIRGGYRH